MDVITTARELGKVIQQDERYLKFSVAQQNNDNDSELQEMIGQFNLSRIALNQEAAKPDKDDAKIEQMNKEVTKLYGAIVQKPGMIAFNEAKADIDSMMNFVMEILRGSVNGENPDEIQEKTECGGGCSSCSGCH